MDLDFWHIFFRQRPVVYKIWLENDGKPISSDYLRLLYKNKPRGSQVVFWSSQAETNALLSKYQDRFPAIYSLFWAQTTSPVMRSDILRLLLIFDRGGIYSDHDAEWKRKHPAFNVDLILWTEFIHSDEAIRKNMEMTREYRGAVPEYNVRICNCYFGSRKPRSAILGRCLARIQDRMQKNMNQSLSPYGVLYTTGPDVMTDTVVEGLPGSATLKPFEKCEYANTEWIDKDGERILLIGRQPGKRIVQHEIHGVWRAAHPQ